MGVRLIVCGGREYDDSYTMYRVLDDIHVRRGIDLLIHGDARGADRMAGRWAEQACVPVHPEPADWEKHGRSAGAIRNRKMLTLSPDGVVAFPGGKGTADMVEAAREVGVPVKEVV